MHVCIVYCDVILTAPLHAPSAIPVVPQAGLGRQQQQHQQRWQKQRHVQAAAAAVSIILLLACSHTAGAVLLSQRPGNVLTMILTDCGKYQDWQTIAAAFAWRQSGQPGSVIRVANCNEQDTKKYDPTMLDYVQTHMAKQVGRMRGDDAIGACSRERGRWS